MNNKKRFVLILVVVLIVLVAAAIIYPPALAFSGYKAFQENKQVNSATLAGPEEIVLTFYNDYLAYEGNPLVDKTYQSNIMLSDDFIAYLDNFTLEGMLYDPILCAQDQPERVVTGKVEIAGDLATVPMLSNFAGHSFKVELHQIDGAWKIDKVVCDTK